MPRGEDRELPFNRNPRKQRDYKPPVPSTNQVPASSEEVSVDDYRTRKQKHQESLGVSGRKEFRRKLNENWDRIAREFLSGTPLEQLIEPWGEGGGPREGRRSVAWDQWTKGLNPGLQRAIRSRDMFKNYVANQGAFFDPEVGLYFNPGGDPNNPEWYNEFYDRVAAPYAGPGIFRNQNAPVNTPPPVNPNEITSGGVTYTPPGSKPTPTRPGPPISIPPATTNTPPSYLTGQSQPQMRIPTSQPWHGYNSPINTTNPRPISPYSQNYNPLSRNAKGPQYRRPTPWRF